MNRMKPSDYEITDLIPQRPPMVMIDKLIFADEKTGIGIFRAGPLNPLCFEGFLSEAGIIESIAQTAAAFTGYSRISRSKAVKKGFIGSVKNLRIYSLPPADSKVISEITVENELLGFTIIKGKVVCNNKLVAECEMRIILENHGNES